MRSFIVTAAFLTMYGSFSAGQDPPRPRPSTTLLDKNRVPTEYNIGPGDVLRILTWKEPDQVLAEAELIAATRPEFDLDSLVNRVPGASGRVPPRRPAHRPSTS